MNTYTYTTYSTKKVYDGAEMVWYVIDIVELLLLLRFFLRFLGANPAASFSNFIYQLTYPLVAPFLNVFQVTLANGRVFEWATILAIVVYWVLASIIVRFFFESTTVITPQVHSHW